jgi:valyl-tRNA synthetase
MAGEKLYQFIWDDFADWYIEIHKIEKNTKVLVYVFLEILKLYHPFIPFVTEKIYQDLYDKKKILMVAKWPVADKKLVSKKVVADFENLQNIITRIRNIRSSYRISPAEIIEAYGKNISEKEIIEKLARVKIINEKGKNNLIYVSGKKTKIGLDISKLIDVEKEKLRLKQEIESLENLIAKNESLLKNASYLKSAPAEVVNTTKVRVKEYREKLKISQELFGNLQKL